MRKGGGPELTGAGPGGSQKRHHWSEGLREMRTGTLVPGERAARLRRGRELPWGFEGQPGASVAGAESGGGGGNETGERQASPL